MTSSRPTRCLSYLLYIFLALVAFACGEDHSGAPGAEDTTAEMEGVDVVVNAQALETLDADDVYTVDLGSGQVFGFDLRDGLLDLDRIELISIDGDTSTLAEIVEIYREDYGVDAEGHMLVLHDARTTSGETTQDGLGVYRGAVCVGIHIRTKRWDICIGVSV